MRYIDQPYSKTIATSTDARVAQTVITTHPSTISRNAIIPSGDNCLLAGPITIAATATLTVSGTLTIV